MARSFGEAQRELVVLHLGRGDPPHRDRSHDAGDLALAQQNGRERVTERMENASIVLPLRIGIAAGKVIVFEGDDFIGMAINLASRLCDAAGPGEILANDEVAAALGDSFPVVPLGQRPIPGIVTPVSVWRVASAPELEDDLPLSFAE